MAIIEKLNSYMPAPFNKTDPLYQAIFGKTPFIPETSIVHSADYKCGAVANELEYVMGFCEYLTRTKLIADFYGDYLARVVFFFTGIRRTSGESDASLRNRFNALVVRRLNKTWITKWMIADVFSYFFNHDLFYVVENYIANTHITDGSFESGNPLWTIIAGSGSTVARMNDHSQFDLSYCMKFHAAASAAADACSLSQVFQSSASAGGYMLDFWVNDDGLVTGPNIAKLTLQRSGDSFYYNFATWVWQVGEAHLLIPKTAAQKYEIRQALVLLADSRVLTMKISNVGGSGSAYNFWADLVEFGAKPIYPTLKVAVINVGNDANFMNVWPGTTDPIVGLNYDYASYLGQCYISGFGGIGTLAFYQGLLEIIKPAGVKGVVEILVRDA